MAFSCRLAFHWPDYNASGRQAQLPLSSAVKLLLVIIPDCGDNVRDKEQGLTASPSRRTCLQDLSLYTFQYAYLFSLGLIAMPWGLGSSLGECSNDSRRALSIKSVNVDMKQNCLIRELLLFIELQCYLVKEKINHGMEFSVKDLLLFPLVSLQS